jgi:hypothetical protein
MASALIAVAASGRRIAAIVDGTAPADLTVTGLAGPALFLDRAGAEHRIVTRLVDRRPERDAAHHH